MDGDDAGAVGRGIPAGQIGHAVFVEIGGGKRQRPRVAVWGTPGIGSGHLLAVAQEQVWRSAAGRPDSHCRGKGRLRLGR
jgi:hypothetical protein